MDKLDAGRLKAAVFDWDGTLAETRTPRLWAVNRIMAKYGLPDWESTREKQNKLLSFMAFFFSNSRSSLITSSLVSVFPASISILFPPFCKRGSLGRPCTLITDYRKGVASLSFSLSGLPCCFSALSLAFSLLLSFAFSYSEIISL